MKALILHRTLNLCGGGERVSLHIIKALMEAGHEVELCTREKTNWNRVLGMLGVSLPMIPREHLVSTRLRLGKLGIYQKLYQKVLAGISIEKIRGKFDVVINTCGTDMLLLPTNIVYQHSPSVAVLFSEGLWKYHPSYLKYRRSYWRLYFEPFRFLETQRVKMIFKKSLLLTNSRFTKNIIKKYIGIDAIVVYPPVEVDDYLRLSRSFDREDAVIIISRFSPEKNLHLVPYIAKELPRVKFYVVGSVGGVGSKEYYQKIVQLLRELDVSNVRLFANLPHEEKLRLIGRCKVLLHLMPFEHFGIAIVEGLASGCVPVVHKSGGQWTDVVERGKYGIGYDKLSPSEIAEAITRALSMWSPRLAKVLASSANRFSDERFRREVLYITERYINS